MPGYANWKTLYKEEYLQLSEEGYDVTGHPAPNIGEAQLPLPPDFQPNSPADALSEARWEAAYRALRSVIQNGIRQDYPFVEPNEPAEILGAASPTPALQPLTRDCYEQRIHAAWLGRCAAVVLGKPLEMGMDRLRIKAYLESVDAYPLNDWVPARSDKLGITLREDCLPSTRGNLAYVQADDDIHYTILALLLAERHREHFDPLEVGMNWLDNIPYHWCWCASRQVYYQLVNMTDDRPKTEQAREMADTLNPWRECIDGQIRGDLWGYIHPAAPEAAARAAHRECSNSLVKNGLYGAMFVAACVAAALSENPTVDGILDAGLSGIPQKSRLAKAITSVREWYAEEGDWVAVADKIYETYGHLPFAATINNLAMVTLSLVHGGLDFTKTITTAVMCGMDTDCNSGTAGSIVAAAVGMRGLEPRWIAPLNDRVITAVAAFGEGSISSLARRTIAQCRTNLPV